MADPLWPATLPQNPYARDGATYTPPDNQLRSNTEIGPPKTRRKFTAVYDRFTFTLELTRTELATLNSFVNVTLQEVRKFQWIDFRTGAICKYRFVKRPTVMYLVGDGFLWEVQIELERMPG